MDRTELKYYHILKKELRKTSTLEDMPHRHLIVWDIFGQQINHIEKNTDARVCMGNKAEFYCDVDVIGERIIYTTFVMDVRVHVSFNLEKLAKNILLSSIREKDAEWRIQEVIKEYGRLLYRRLKEAGIKTGYRKQDFDIGVNFRHDMTRALALYLLHTSRKITPKQYIEKQLKPKNYE